MARLIFDAHVHFGPSTQWEPHVNPVVTIEEVLDKMDSFGIRRSLVFPNPNVGDRYPEVNDIMACAQKDHPNRIIGFGRVDPRRGEEAISELQRLRELGLRGVKLHPYVECFRPDHPSFDGFWGAVNDLKLSVLIHTGTMFSSPGYLVPVLKSYPEMRVILGHLQEGCIPLMTDYKNVYSDTSGSRVHLLEYAVKSCGNRIMFGSDFPYLSHRVEMEVVNASEITKKAKDRIFSGNFRDFFGF